MGLIKPSIVTEKKAAASRRNAQQYSTGPRTEAGKERSRLNAQRHGIYSTIRTRVAMLELGEDPAQFDALCDRLRTCYGYDHDPLIAVEVDELAWLLWRKQRLERGRDAILAEAKRKADTEARRREREHRRDTLDEEEVRRVGLRRLQDSPLAFEGSLLGLQLLQQAADQGQISLDEEAQVRRLYGQDTYGTQHGPAIERLCHQLAHPEDKAERAVGSRKEARTVLSALLRLERVQVEAEYALYREDHIEPSLWARNACLAPNEEWRELIRESYHLDRAIDRKVALLMKLRSEWRKQVQWEWEERKQWEAEAEAEAESVAPGFSPAAAEAEGDPMTAEPSEASSVAAVSDVSDRRAVAQSEQATTEVRPATAEASPASSVAVVSDRPAVAQSGQATADASPVKAEPSPAGDTPSPEATAAAGRSE